MLELCYKILNSFKISNFLNKSFLFKIVISLLIIAIAVLWFSPKQQLAVPDQKLKDPKIFHVLARKITAKNNRLKLRFFGLVKANEESIIKSKLKATVEKVFVKRGDHIKKGQQLLKLEDTTYSSQLLSAKAALAEAKLNYQTVEKLYKQKHRSKSHLLLANAKLQKIKNDIVNCEQLIRNTKIISNIDGIILEKLPKVGQTINSSEKICTVMDNQNMKIVFHVSEKNIDFITLGSKCTFARAKHRLNAKVSYISPRADEKTRTFLCEAKILPIASKNHLANLNLPHLKNKLSIDKIIHPNETVKLYVSSKSITTHNLPLSTLELTADGEIVVSILTNLQKKPLLSTKQNEKTINNKNKNKQAGNKTVKQIGNTKIKQAGNTETKQSKQFARLEKIRIEIINQTKDYISVKGLNKNIIAVIRGGGFVKSGAQVAYSYEQKQQIVS